MTRSRPNGHRLQSWQWFSTSRSAASRDARPATMSGSSCANCLRSLPTTKVRQTQGPNVAVTVNASLWNANPCSNDASLRASIGPHCSVLWPCRAHGLSCPNRMNRNRGNRLPQDGISTYAGIHGRVIDTQSRTLSHQSGYGSAEEQKRLNVEKLASAERAESFHRNPHLEIPRVANDALGNAGCSPFIPPRLDSAVREQSATYHVHGA